MTDPEKVNRIPAADTADFASWHFPEVAAGHIVPAASEAVRRQRAREAELVHRSLTASELESITARAHAEGVEQGRARGLEQGHAEGLERGLAEGRRRVDEQVARLRQLQQRLLFPLGEQRDALEQALWSLAKTLARMILEREPSADAAAVLQVVRTAVAALPQGAENIQVFLNPEDLELLGAGADPAWQVRPDPALGPGDCRVATRHSLVDFTRETRLRQLLQSLDDVLPPGGEHDPPG